MEVRLLVITIFLFGDRYDYDIYYSFDHFDYASILGLELISGRVLRDPLITSTS